VGSLHLSAHALPLYNEAKRYLCADSAERRIFSKLEHAPHTVHLRLDARNDDSYDPNCATIHWDPYSALRTTGGGRQSPALGLGHEADHATEPERLREPGFDHILHNGYDNAEERRVIRGSETHAAHTLGEAIRHNHRGSCYRVDSPISR